MSASGRTDLPQGAMDYLREGFLLWEHSGMPLPDGEERCRYAGLAGRIYAGEHAAEFSAACQCFALFRTLHGQVRKFPTEATLLGDYFFSRFSRCLIPLDSVALTDAFADYLKADIAGRAEEYERFLEGLPALIQS